MDRRPKCAIRCYAQCTMGNPCPANYRAYMFLHNTLEATPGTVRVYEHGTHNHFGGRRSGHALTPQIQQ
eukprot:4118260-Prorocentrum_lima.AAC.1